MSDSTLKDIALRINRELFAGGRLEVADELYQPGLGERVKRLVALLRKAFPDLAVEVEHLIAEGDKVACHWRATGTQRDWFHGIPPTEAQVSWTGTSIYVIADGRVAAMASNWDLFGVLQQLREALNR